jgi:hypothetical protein
MADLLWRLLCCGTVPEGSKLLDASKAGDPDTARSLVEKRPALARKAQQWGEPEPDAAAGRRGRPQRVLSTAPVSWDVASQPRLLLHPSHPSPDTRRQKPQPSHCDPLTCNSTC